MSDGLDNTNLVMLFGEMNDDMAKSVVSDLYDKAAKVRDLKAGFILMLISSGGGSLWAGMTIRDALRQMQIEGIPVVGRVHGLCASAATLPFMECDSREMSKDSTLAIHGITDFLVGDMDDLKGDVTLNEKLTELLSKLYSQHSNFTKPYWKRVLQRNLINYYSAKEALEAGLIDVIY